MCCSAGSARKQSSVNWRARAHGARRLLAALLILVTAALAGLLPVAAQRPNGAGLAIALGDGSVIYAYVQFEEESIASDELLLRSGLDVIVAPFGGLGLAVCSIQGTGCPADNCWCQSYSNPAYFWHFYAQQDGVWVEQLLGPSSREVGDGDIDGWSWTAGEPGLPAVTIDEIALLNGVDRNAPEPTETPLPTDTPAPPPPPTDTPEATATMEATATLPPAPATATATATAPLTPTSQAATATTFTAATATETATGTTTEPPAPTPTSAPRATSTSTRSPSTAIATLTIVASATTVAVLVRPDGTPVPLNIEDGDDGSPATPFLIFGALAAVVVGIGAVVFVRNRGAARNGIDAS
jgi:hypothetical protein